ncbi:hypothetical protein H8356DRAFT_1432670 [Neocallimastix lanati (nom. inval.)]|nr:hypothetical protein H8356DRAFT_1432670 [Neocallimastix sp. JGI-2020a]
MIYLYERFEPYTVTICETQVYNLKIQRYCASFKRNNENIVTTNNKGLIMLFFGDNDDYSSIIPNPNESIINIEFIPPPLQYPFTLIINNHLLLTNGPERNMFSIWSIKTGELFYDLPESEALEKLDLHLPA